MKKIITVVTLIGIVLSFSSCTDEVKQEIAKPIFKPGDEVKFKVSKFSKKAVILEVDTIDKPEIKYIVSYFTLWDTRRIKKVSEFEIEK